MAYTTIDDSSQYFHIQLYTSNNGYEVSVVNDAHYGDFKPDILWVKSRYTIGGYDYNHNLIDSSRGVTKTLWPDDDDVEMTATQSNYDLKSFDTDGFTNGAPEYTNSLGGGNLGKVAWQWKVNGGTTASNTDGDVTSTVQVNQTAGIGIATWAGSNGTPKDIGHGLGVEPDLIIIRNRTRAETWWTYFKVMGHGGNGLNELYTYNTTSTALVTGADSSVFGVGTDYGVNGNWIYVAWYFKAIKGFSKFGKYTGTGGDYNTDPFVWCGFKPAFVMIKDTSQQTNWIMFDSARNPYNVADLKLGSNKPNAENGSDFGNSSQNNIDMLSNGFKLLTGNTDTNVSGDVYVFVAFAENPFVTSSGVPGTAR